jgi:methyl-accepting chemotaxis protein
MFNSSRLQSVRTLRYTVVLTFIIAMISGAASIYLVRSMGQANRRLSSIDSATADSLSLYAAGLQMGQATRNILLDPANSTAYANHSASAKEFSETVSALKQEMHDLFPDSDAGRKLESIQSDFRDHLGVQQKIHSLARSGNFAQAKEALNSEDTPLWRKYKQKLLDFRKWLDGQATQASTKVQDDCRMAELLSWICGLMLLAASLGTFLVSGVVGKRLRAVSQTLADGADQIARAAGQVASSSQTLAQGATEQAASLEETSASTEEVGSMARRNDQSSKSASTLVRRSHEQLSETNRALDQTVNVISEINDSSGKISRIIKVIDEIAFQTNILALNAAVEAARAGEAGQGFGVVADEVRNLAQRCAQAAQDTASLIEESVGMARNAKTKIDQVAAAVEGVVTGAAQIQVLTDEVSMGTRQQSQGLEHIGKAIAQIERTTQMTAASAEESASAAAELDAQSRSLTEMVAHLAVTISGRSGQSDEMQPGRRRG